MTTFTGAAEIEPPRYRAAGAPPAPKVQARWNRFYDYAEATALLQQLAEAHPDRCRLESLGTSTHGREMWVLTVTNFDTGEAASKPAMWIDGAIHGNEVQATEVVLYTAWYLLEMDGHNERITQLLRDRAFYLMPMMSPDARDAHMHEPNTTHSPRTGLAEVAEGEPTHGFVDLDGNGHITQMRVRDPNGRHKPHPEFPNLMVRVGEDERGEYRLLGFEHLERDEVADEARRRTTYDPNRDWPWQWQPRYVQQGAHRYPFSVPENRLVSEFLLARPNIAAAQSYHNTGGMLLRGPGRPEHAYERDDVRIFDVIGEKGEIILPGYRYMEMGRDLYPGGGVELDWFYNMRGVITYTNELFTAFNYFRRASEGLLGSSEDIHRFDRYLLLGDGIVAWRAFDHPLYGEIEIGGIKKNWVRQPPAFMIEEECHRNMAFTLYHAEQMPRVRVRSVRSEDLGGGLRQITATVANDAMIPTRLAVDVKRHITPADRVTLHGDVTVVAALVSDEPKFIEPTEQRHEQRAVRVATIPGHGARYVRWIVRGEGDVAVTIRSHKGGFDQQRLDAVK